MASSVSRREDFNGSRADALEPSATRRRLTLLAALLAGLALESLAQQAFVRGVSVLCPAYAAAAGPWRAEFRQQRLVAMALEGGALPWRADGDSVLLQTGARVAAAGRPGVPRHRPSGAGARKREVPQPALLTSAAHTPLDAWERDYVEDDGNPLPEPETSSAGGARPELQAEEEYSENFPRDDQEASTVVSNGTARKLAAATGSEDASAGGSQRRVEMAQSKLRAAEQALEAAKAKESETHSELERVTRSLSESEAELTGDSAVANAARRRDQLGERVSELAIELRRTMADLEKAKRDYDRATAKEKKKKKKHTTSLDGSQNVTEVRERLESAQKAEDSASQTLTAAVSKVSDAERELRAAESDSHAARLAGFLAFALLLVAFDGDAGWA